MAFVNAENKNGFFLLLMMLPIVVLLPAMVVSSINFGSGRTSVMQGAVHLIIFISYTVLIFD